MRDEATLDTMVEAESQVFGKRARRVPRTSRPSIWIGLAVSGAATAEGSHDLGVIAGTPMENLGGTGMSIRAQLPVTDHSRERLSRAVDGLLPTTGGDPAASLSHLLDTARGDGEVTARAVDVDSSTALSVALSGELPGVGGAGVNVDAGSSNQEVYDAWYRGSDGWNTWEACRG